MHTTQIVLSLAFFNLKFILQIFHIGAYILASLLSIAAHYFMVCEVSDSLIPLTQARKTFSHPYFSLIQLNFILRLYSPGQSKLSICQFWVWHLAEFHEA